MRNYSIFALFLFVLSTFYVVNEVNANSEFFVYTPNGSYNLGCELDNSCFEPHIVRIESGDTVTWINNDDAIHVVTSGNPTSFSSMAGEVIKTMMAEKEEKDLLIVGQKIELLTEQI